MAFLERCVPTYIWLDISSPSSFLSGDDLLLQINVGSLSAVREREESGLNTADVGGAPVGGSKRSFGERSVLPSAGDALLWHEIL